LPPDVKFEEAALIVGKNNIGRIFVCERGKIVDLVSLLDVLSAELIMGARGIKSSDDHLAKETRSDFTDRWQRIFQFITFKSISDL
jgi:signal-transduction protein with cAMP-binding, CBS, and nucleotidyltransferase domain